MARVIFHIDLNAFFANAEIILNPDLKGKAIAVASSNRRSVVTTASYEARKYGIHSAMPTSQALSLYKDLIVVEGHHEYYEELSNKFMDIIRSYSDIVEQASIDECYVDVTDIISKYPKPLDLATEIQRRVYNDLKLPSSIGIAPNKFLAKMASDLKKPMGIFILRKREVNTKLWPIDISKMYGIGNKTIPLLRNIGINTIGDLANYQDINKLKQVFKNNTLKVIERANGIDDNEIVTYSESKSFSYSTTLLEDISEYDEIKAIFFNISRKLAHKLKEENKVGLSISIIIKYFDFNQVVRSKKLETGIYTYKSIFENSMDIFDLNYDERPIRLLGISINKLVDKSSYMAQINLFNEEEDDTLEILNELNNMLKNGKIVRASNLIK